MDLPSELLARARLWSMLPQWGRKELAQDLRKAGLSYRQIMGFIPVAKATLSSWCRDIELTPAQVTQLRALNNSQLARRRAGATLRSRSIERVRAIRAAAREEAASLLDDPFWVAGVVAYWAEGAKRTNRLQFSNSDFRMVLLFLNWTSKYLGLASLDRFAVQLHLHSGQNEQECKQFWSDATGLPLNRFKKCFIKQEGTGHRKHVLYNGTASVRVSASTDLFHRVMEWIEAFEASLQQRPINSLRASSSTAEHSALNR